MHRPSREVDTSPRRRYKPTALHGYVQKALALHNSDRRPTNEVELRTIAQILSGSVGSESDHKRSDIQGLRMVAVLLVFAAHLFGWPAGGFVGVDVFFVISGFLITGNLLRMAESRGNISFKRFYLNRFKRIVPASTAVLLLTCIAAVVLFQPARARQVGIDALSAATFVSNWRFATSGTDYFAEGNAVSPIRYFWSLSIEEQFYFLWPAVVFLIGLVAARKSLSHAHRVVGARWVICGVVLASFGWALHQTTAAPTLAYFDTFARIWELGAGALLATVAGPLGRIPSIFRPFLSWSGIGLVAVSALVIAESSPAFPAPLGLLPVVGSAMVIAAGIGHEPAYQPFLTNRIARYIGGISYSLYLVHWPVIIVFAAYMAPNGAAYYIVILTIAFALAIFSYHFIENPCRYGKWRVVPSRLTLFGRENATPTQRNSGRRSEYLPLAGIAVLGLFVVGLTTFIMRPIDRHAIFNSVPADVVLGVPPPAGGPKLEPLTSSLQREIAVALTATEWPALDPSMESVISDGSVAPPEMVPCAVVGIPNPDSCTWGRPDAPTRIMLVGDSIALTYGAPLRELALNSAGQLQLRVEAMPGCQFVDMLMKSSVKEVEDECPGRIKYTLDAIASSKPDILIVSNNYVDKTLPNGESLNSDQWAEAVHRIAERIRGDVKKLVWLSAPPADRNVRECFSKKSSVPADCVGEVTSQWISIARAEQEIAKGLAGAWIDSRPWFCTSFKETEFCPAFVGTTPTKSDLQHMAPAYGRKIYQVIGESLESVKGY